MQSADPADGFHQFDFKIKSLDFFLVFLKSRKAFRAQQQGSSKSSAKPYPVSHQELFKDETDFFIVVEVNLYKFYAPQENEESTIPVTRV